MSADFTGEGGTSSPCDLTIRCSSSGADFELSPEDLARLYGRPPAAVRRRLTRLADLQADGLDSPRERRLFVRWLEGGTKASTDPPRRRRVARRIARRVPRRMTPPSKY